MPAVPKLPKTPPDALYRAWIKTQVCCLANKYDACRGCTDAHHAGHKPGMRMKAPDSTCIALCRKHHDAWGQLGIPFKNWTIEERWAWAYEEIRIHRARYKADQGIDEFVNSIL